MPRIDAFLELGRQQGCSDIHLAVGTQPMLRLHGELVPIKYRIMDAAEIDSVMAEIITDEQLAFFEQGQDIDFSYDSPAVGRFRVNLFRKLGGIGATFRVIPAHIPSLDQLGMPDILKRLTEHTHGLVLVTGATGTGKTTTLAAMIDRINERRRLNIITLEDPIEFVHPSKKSLVIQREVGTHVPTFYDGLRAALREDPDVVLVGELRDPETIAMAMIAAETGHLVLGTLHTTSAVKTLDRIIDAMPTEQKPQTASFLAQHLHGVISQRLIRTADGRGRKAILEIMISTPAIANMILTGKAFQISSQLQTGRELGMQTLDQALLDAVQRKEIDPDEAYLNADEKKLFQRFVSNPDLLPQVSLAGN